MGHVLVGRTLSDAFQPLVDRASHDLRRCGLHLDLFAAQLTEFHLHSMPAIPGLRSPHDTLGPLIYVGRMFDKIRLHDRGELPEDFNAALGAGLDARACAFLGVDYVELKSKVLTGSSDEAILQWCFETGTSRDPHDCTVWNAFLQKLGWHDDRSEFLQNRVAKSGFTDRGIHTFFDLIEIDEDRPIRSTYV